MKPSHTTVVEASGCYLPHISYAIWCLVLRRNQGIPCEIHDGWKREERGRREGGEREERGESVRELRKTILQGGWSHLFTWVFSCTSGTHMGGEASNLPCFLAAPGNSLRDVSEADPSVSRESWKMKGGTEAE